MCSAVVDVVMKFSKVVVQLTLSVPGNESALCFISLSVFSWSFHFNCVSVFVFILHFVYELFGKPYL